MILDNLLDLSVIIITEAFWVIRPTFGAKTLIQADSIQVVSNKLI